MMESFKNRRWHYRVKAEKKYPIRIDINGENFVEILNAQDISLGGIGIIVPHQFKDCEIDDDVSIMLSLPIPVKVTLSLSGKIKHLSQKAFGVQFTKMDKKTRKLILDYINLRMSEYSFFHRFLHYLKTLPYQF